MTNCFLDRVINSISVFIDTEKFIINKEKVVKIKYYKQAIKKFKRIEIVLKLK